MARLWKKAHLLRCAANRTVQRIFIYASRFGFLHALHLNLFAKPCELVEGRLWKKAHLLRCTAFFPGFRRGRLFAAYNFVKGN